MTMNIPYEGYNLGTASRRDPPVGKGMGEGHCDVSTPPQTHHFTTTLLESPNPDACEFWWRFHGTKMTD